MLDASDPETRPRALDASAIRDLAGSMKREGLALGGVELHVPPDHWASSEHVSRAVDATVAALSLAADIHRLQPDPFGPSLWCTLGDDPDVLREIEAAAVERGVGLIDFGSAASHSMTRQRGVDGALIRADRTLLKDITDGPGPVGGVVWEPSSSEQTDPQLLRAVLDVVSCRRSVALRVAGRDAGAISRAVSQWSRARLAE